MAERRKACYNGWAIAAGHTRPGREEHTMEETKTQTRPWQVRVNLLELGAGVCLVWLGFFMPVFFTVGNFRILETLYQALDHWEKTGLMLAALKLVALNSLRGIPHYIGAFLIAESVEYRWKGHNLWVINALMALVVLLCTYRSIDALHRVHYDFGLPAVLVAALLLVFEKMNYQYITVTKKVMFIAVLVVTFQFLDIMPAANGLPMGRGEISGDVKLASEILGANTAMNAMAAAGLVVFLLMLVLLFFQLRVENNLRQLNILREQNLAIRTEARMNEMKNRTYREMQYLVHDLKSPLASAQTLVGVIKMECEAEGRTQDVEYLSRIEGAVEQMNRMISEILYEEQATPETVERLVDRALAQLSVESYAACVHTELKTPEAMVRVNRVLFPRALVNLPKVAKDSINSVLPVMGILMGVGMFIQIMTLTGVRGLIVTSCLSLPGWALYVAMAVSMPLFGAVSSFGSASVLGVPFLLAFLNKEEIIVAAALSLIASLGDMMPPTALAGIFAAQVVGLEKYTPVLKKCLVPCLMVIVWGILFILGANVLEPFIIFT